MSLSFSDTTDLRARRLIAQLLSPSAARPPLDSLAETATWLTAVQAQNAAAGREALALRTGADSLSPADLSAAGVVRSWSQRGTHHYLPARDVRWITLLCSPRVQRASAKRRGLLGLTDADVDLGRTALLAALADGTSLTRTQCYGVFRDAGVDPGGGRGPHMLRHFGGEGDIIQGVPAGREETFVLHDAAVSDPVDLTGEDALGALASRYFRSRGPATVKDFAWWTGLTVTDAKKGTALAVAAGAVIEASAADGRTMYLGDWQVDVTDAELADAVSPEHADIPLPAFDEYLMAYTDRSDIITPDVTAEVGPTKNGLVHPSVLRAGVVTARR
ncbi:winged helix DNA-binding domain-containing protein [Corynebacterium variabile]|uniref:winged helix DNA-binding domain-containing protein n=1 Tax=Corynebacterium variabile TaxID=1727 RepID=UPI0028B08D16|nr:winged helix DNA-binding domain-containing protein [Corynebacterium variabile]